MGYVDRGGGSLTTRPIVNGRVNDTFVFILFWVVIGCCALAGISAI